MIMLGLSRLQANGHVAFYLCGIFLGQRSEHSSVDFNQGDLVRLAIDQERAQQLQNNPGMSGIEQVCKLLIYADMVVICANNGLGDTFCLEIRAAK